MRILSFATILFILLTCSAMAQTEEPCPTPPPFICSPVLMDGVQISEETAGYIIDINYPVLCESDATITIRDYVTRALSDFKMEFPDHDLSDYPHKHSMNVQYAIWTTGNGRIASVKLQTTIFTGGAHPNHWPHTWVFDMADGEPFAMDEIFINPRDALIDIAAITRDVLTASLGPMHMADMLADGTTPTADNYEDFILTDEGFAVFFAPYQVAPYAAGQRVVTIPWADLDKHLKPEFKAILF